MYMIRIASNMENNATTLLSTVVLIGRVLVHL